MKRTNWKDEKRDMKILLIEDDQATREYLVSVLETNHFVVDVVFDGQEGLEYARSWEYDAIVVDLQIPKINGISFCRELRSHHKKTPILILTACQERDKISKGLDAGADDYVLKPCDPTQLISRIRALLRRGNNIFSSSVLTWGPLSLDVVSAQVTYQQQEVNLRNQEYHLLELFLRHPQRIFSRSAIIERLWQAGDIPSESAVTNLVKDVRRKLKAAGMTENIFETLYGLGYRLKPVPTDFMEEKMAEQAQEKTKEYEEGITLINQLTDKFLLSLYQRITTLEETIVLLQADKLSIEKRQQAQEEAHRLAGSLGTYGYSKGSQLARSIETLLKTVDIGKSIKTDQLVKLITELKQKVSVPKKESILNSDPIQVYPLILGIGLNESLLTDLQQKVYQWKLELKNFSDLEEISNFLDPINPTIILFNLQKGENKNLQDLRQLQEQFSTIPVLIIAEKNNLSDRLKVSHYGIKKYLVEPVSTQDILETTQTVVSSLSSSQRNIMIMDDDPTIITAIRNLLHPWGFIITGVNQPDQFWEILTQTNPDLLLLDLEMPTINGLELCRIVRQDKQYNKLPILIITVHTEVKYLQQSFEAGANDFLGKPIVKSELVARVLNQINK